MKLDWKLTAFTLVAFIGLNPVFSTIHEAGHAYVCWSNGYEFIINPTLTGTYFACEKFEGDNAEALRLSMYMAGGFFASALAFLTFSFGHGLKLFTGRKKAVAYALVTIGIVHFYQLIAETFAHDFYMESKFTIPILTFTSLILLLVFLFRGSKPFLEQKAYVNPPHSKPEQYDEPEREIPQSIYKRDIRDILKGRKPKKPKYFDHNEKKPTADILKGEED